MLAPFIWLLPFLSGVCDTATRKIMKESKTNPFLLTALSMAFALPYYFLFLAIYGFVSPQPMFWVAIGVHAPLHMMILALTAVSHRLSPMVLTAPFLSLTPAFLLITVPVMNAISPQTATTSPNMLGGFGVLIITAGIYIMNIDPDKKDFWYPFRAYLREKGSWVMTIVALLAAVSSIFDLIGINNSNYAVYLVYDAIITVPLALFMAFIFFRLKGKDADPREFSLKGMILKLLILGSGIAVASILFVVGIKLIGVVPYVICIKRGGTIALTIALGIFMGLYRKHKDYIKEGENLWFRLPGATLMVIGMIIILIWGNA